MRCPECKLISPPESARCDCGYDFVAGEMRESFLPEITRGQRGRALYSAKYGRGCLSGAILVATYLAVFAMQGTELRVQVFLGICALLGVTSAIWLKKIRGRDAARLSSSEAQAVSRNLASGKPVEPFLLYLRPF